MTLQAPMTLSRIHLDAAQNINFIYRSPLSIGAQSLEQHRALVDGADRQLEVAMHTSPFPDIYTVIFIPLTQGKFACIDIADYPKIAPFKWCAMKCPHGFYAGSAFRFGPIGRRGGHKYKRTILMHRFILDNKGAATDHRDHDRLNNRRQNLRACTGGQNRQNSLVRKTNSGFKGACWYEKRGKFRAGITVGYKGIHLGLFDKAEDAARAYDRAAIKYFGEFAHINFPREDYR